MTILRAESVGISDISDGGTNSNGKFLPRAINCLCPFCSTTAVFTLNTQFGPNDKAAKTILSRCPSCSEISTFAIFWHEGMQPSDIVRFPSSSALVSEIEIPEGFPSPLTDAIREAEKSYHASLYTASIICSGRALEGLLKKKLDSKKMLRGLIEDLVVSNLALEPIKALSKALQNGRNSAAHFDEFFVADEDSARQALRLLEHFISYFIHFERDAISLQNKLKPKEES